MSRQCKALEKKYLQGRSIEPIRLRRGMSVYVASPGDSLVGLNVEPCGRFSAG